MSPELVHLLRRFANPAYLRHLKGTPCLGHLPTVIHLNLLNAMASNATMLDMSQQWLICDAVSRFCLFGPMHPLPPQQSQPWPASMQPTSLQLAVPHHPWIDLFPLPALRDNILMTLLVAADPEQMEDELWYDMIEIRSGRRCSDSPSLIVWGSHPWDIHGWEANGAFLQKWGHLLQGCDELLASTNYWRGTRGEKRISFS
jgi:hypothetical protein